jgi:hypothetical protein
MTTFLRRPVGLMILPTLLTVLLALVPMTLAQDNLSVPASDLEPDVLVNWMELLYDRIQAETINAPAASRLYAYAGITGYQAVVPGIEGGISMSGQVYDLPEMPLIDSDAIYDWPSSANGALATLLPVMLPESAETAQAVRRLQQQQQRARERDVDSEVVLRSMEYGKEVAQIILDWMEDDGYLDILGAEYESPTGDDSLWVPTREGMRAVEPYWGELRGFALSYPGGCMVEPTMEFSTDPDSTFYKQALEVKLTGDNLTDWQRDTARYWVDTPGMTGAPAGHWMMIVSDVIDQLELKLDMASMAYGLVGISLGDAFISTWYVKYQYNLLRPVTYIQRYIDPEWEPFIASPGFPEYPSGHSVASTAAATVLTRMFGTVAWVNNSVQKNGFEPRAYTSFRAASDEAAISRLYGGIHYRQAIELGITHGECVGNNVIDYILLRSVPQGE